MTLGEKKEATEHWVTGYAHLYARYMDVDNVLVRDTLSMTGYSIQSVNKTARPTHVEIAYYVGEGEAARLRAEEILKCFAKSAGMRVSGLTGPGRYLHTVVGTVSFLPDKTTGELNESGARRYRQMVKGFEKQGIEVRTHPPYVSRVGNAYSTKEEFEASLEEHMHKDEIEISC